MSGRMPSFSGPPVFVCVCWPVPAVEAFRLRDACWNPASSPGTNPPGVEALVVVEEGGARGGGVVGRLGGPVQGAGGRTGRFPALLAAAAWQAP